MRIIMLVLLSISICSCNKNNPPTTSFNPFPHYQGTSSSLNLNTKSAVQVKFHVGTQEYHYEFNYGDSTVNIHYAAKNSFEQSTSNSRKYSMTLINNVAQPVFSIRKGTLIYIGIPGSNNATDGPTKAEFQSFFQPGLYTVADNADFGIELNWSNNDLVWSSSNNSSESNVFEILESEFLNNGIRYHAEFDCLLYNYQGDSVHLESGEIVAYHAF